MLQTTKKLSRRIYNGFKWADLSSPQSFYDTIQMYRLMYKVRHYTMLDMTQLILLYRLTKKVNADNIPGDIVQCGAWNGGSGALMTFVAMQSNLKRDIWLFDSFQGMPEPTEKDGGGAWSCCKDPYFVADPQKVRDILGKLNIGNDHIHIAKGWFQDTFPISAIKQISLLHIDADWYESVKLCLEHFYDKVSVGGYVVLDDYGLYGCKEATDEFIVKRGLKIELIQPTKVGCHFQKEQM